MKKLTKSEELFERLCQMRGISCQRIPEGETRRPDYRIAISSFEILIEVKQLDENDDDRLLNSRLLRSEEIMVSEWPAKRVRHQIAEAYVQLKSYYREKLATGVVLFNNAGHLTYIDD